MFTINHTNTVLSIFVSLFLIFAGCSDSGTNSNEENGNGNGGNNQSVSFESGPIAPGESFNYTFEAEAVVEYYCTIHTPDMQGQVTVTSNAEAVDQDTVRMENNQFIPENLEVAPNTKVIWVNNQDHNHDIETGNPSASGGGDY